MKVTKFDGTMERAYNYPLSKLKTEDNSQLPDSLPFSGEFDAFENIGEVNAANEYPKDADIVDFVNNKRKANARQKAMQAVLDSFKVIKPTMKNDEQLQLKTVYDAIMAGGKRTHEQARAIAATTVGADWAE